MKCEDCRFFQFEPGDKEQGRCRRNPPMIPTTGVWFLGSGFTSTDAGEWPVISFDDWCGEFSAHPATTKKFFISGEELRSQGPGLSADSAD